MPRWARRLLIGVGAFALLVGGAYLALVKGFPPQRIAALLSGELSQRTGRDFRIQGELDYRVLPRIAVVVEDLALANAAWGTRADMLRVQRAALQLELWPLLQGQVKIGSVVLDGVDLLLETDAKGLGNWDMPGLAGDTAAAAPDGGATRSIDLDRLRLGDVKLAYRDGVNDRQHNLALQQLALERNAQGHRLKAEGSVQAQRWQVDGQLGPLGLLLANQTAWPFTLQLRSVGARVDVAAQLLAGPAPRTGSLDIEATLDKVAALAPWVEQPSRVPLPIELKSTLKLSTEQVQAEPLQLSMAGQALTGSATLRNGKPWQLDAQLSAATLDLKRLLPASGAGASGKAAARTELFDDTPLPFDALPKGVAKVVLQVDKLLLPDATPLSALRASLELRGNSLKIEPLSFGVSEGQVRGSMALSTGAAAAPQLRLQLDGSGLSAEALARIAGLGYAVSGGRVQLKAGLSLSGHTARAMAAGANGDLLLSVKGVTLGDGLAPIGPNLLPRLLGAITLQRGAAKSTTLECAVLRLPFRNGLAQVDRSIAIETPDLAISAAGHIDLRDQTLELAFRPTPKGALGLNNAQLASLVMAKGPIIDPKLTLDAKGVAGMALSIGAAVASGGLSMLAQNMRKQAGDPHPCEFAATGVASKAPAPPSGKAAEPASAEPALPAFLRRIFK